MLYHEETVKATVTGPPEIGYAVFGGYVTYPYVVFFEGPEGERQDAKASADAYVTDRHPTNLQVIKVYVDTMTPVDDDDDDY